MDNSLNSSWKTLGLFVCTLALAAGLQAAETSVKILTTDATALAGTSSGSFTLIRKGDINVDLSVNLDISGTAANGVDYAPISSPVIIPAGYLAIDVPVQPIVNSAVRGNKTVTVTLQDTADYRIIGRGHGTVKIVDDIFDIPPPTVSLTSPADGSVFTSPAVVTLSADVSESELPVQRVGFYVDDKLVGTVTNAPYSMTWTNNKNGKFTVFARAVDEFDKAGVSDTARITVSATPVVTLVSPVGNDVFSRQLIPLEAHLGDANESIQSVSFYINKKLVGTVTSAPFTFFWEDNTIGTFTIQAVATDANTGKIGNSNKLTVNVTRFIGGN